MKRTFNPNKELFLSTTLFVYREIIGYPPMPTFKDGGRSREETKRYISDCVSKDCAPKLIILNKDKEMEITCMITDIQTTEFVTLYYMLNFFVKRDDELLILAVPTDPDSISPPCILCDGNKNGRYKPFEPFSQATNDLYEEFCKEHGW